MIFSWIAGLGLASKLTIGASAVAVGVAGGGAVGVLPPVAQEAFDDMVATVTEDTGETEAPPAADAPDTETTEPEPAVDDGPDEAEGDGAEKAPEEILEEAETPLDDAESGEEAEGETPTEETTHGDRVSAVARDATLIGRDRGKAVSEVARSRGQEQRGRDKTAEADEGGDRDEVSEEPEDDREDDREDEDDSAPAGGKKGKHDR